MKRIFCDMDGVLADFTGAALQLHGCDIAAYPRGNYDMVQVLGMTTSEFWKPINAAGFEFWESLAPCKGSSELWEMLEPHKPIILTSPSISAECVKGKLLWIQSVFGSDFRDYIFCPAGLKHNLAKQGIWLIDDSQANVSDWAHAGGFPYLWPSIGNPNHAMPIDKALSKLRDLINVE